MQCWAIDGQWRVCQGYWNERSDSHHFKSSQLTIFNSVFRYHYAKVLWKKIFLNLLLFISQITPDKNYCNNILKNIKIIPTQLQITYKICFKFPGSYIWSIPTPSPIVCGVMSYYVLANITVLHNYKCCVLFIVILFYDQCFSTNYNIWKCVVCYLSFSVKMFLGKIIVVFPKMWLKIFFNTLKILYIIWCPKWNLKIVWNVPFKQNVNTLSKKPQVYTGLVYFSRLPPLEVCLFNCLFGLFSSEYSNMIYCFLIYIDGKPT